MEKLETKPSGLPANVLEKRGANRIRIGFIAAFVLLLLSNILSFISTSKVNEQSLLVTHTNRVIHDLDNLLSFVIRAESSFRGFLIDKRKSQTELFAQSQQKIDSVLTTLKMNVADDTVQLRNIDELEALLGKSLSSLESEMQQFGEDTVFSEQIFQENAKANILLLDIESKVHSMQDTERTNLTNRSGSISGYSELIKYLSVISIIVAVLLTLYSILVFNKENQAKTEADNKALGLRKQLENRVQELADVNTELVALRSQEKYAATGRIARTIAHEVRNPLTNINLAIEQLRTDFKNEDGATMFFDMINRNSDRINKLVSDLLNSTRLAELNRKPVSANEILDESLAEAGDRIALEHIHVIKKYDKDMDTISVDQEKVKIAFVNLLVNAIEAMKTGGTLTITTQHENDICNITISDTGCGMSKEHLSRLFEPFFTTKSKGNGLGLANTQNIILSHNGVIKAESEEGKGTTFSISFHFDHAS